MSRLVFILLLMTIIKVEAQNLVANPSFEQVKKTPTNWSANSLAFSNTIEDWTSPNGGSPDVFFIGNMPAPNAPISSRRSKGKARKSTWFQRPNVDVYPHAPRSGKYMVGMKTYGCISGTMHCKEYLQTKLTQPLVTGEEYFFEYWVNPIATSIKVNNFGVYVTDQPLSGGDGEEAIWVRPEFQETSIVDAEVNDWVRIAGTFIAGCDCEFLIIGNFNVDENTKHKEEENGIDYSYYLVDDIILRPLHPTAERLEDRGIDIGNTIVLDRIYFDWDETTLLSKSITQLEELYDLLIKYPNMQVQINGHTDASGSHSYNADLSERRCQAVVNYLFDRGITSSRVNTKYFGETQPIATNETAAGRQLNRRVEFLIQEL